jgi:hypothetical protein
MGEVMATGEVKVDIAAALKDLSTPEIAEALSRSMDTARRRDLVGGLIRYLKDGERDFANLLFHYVHVDDYGQAMIEGWSELHKLLTEPSRLYGPFGISYARFDFWEQAVMSTLYEQAEKTMEIGEEEATRKRIIEAASRVRIYRGSDLLVGCERNEIDQMVKGFAVAGGLEDLLAPEEDDPDDGFSDEEDEEFTYEEEPDEACPAPAFE